ncbi:MAG: deoxyribose-phosphate aldolase [Actinomycetia bacterium]|nr:deoxyribose-phosphate aldolase [Actinomycetes bacterium]
MDLAAVASRALPLVDLTSLNDDDTPERIDKLCDDALAAGVAAVCVFGPFVARCRGRLAGSDIEIATVVNFPQGGAEIAPVVDEVVAAVENGADEIDTVIPLDAAESGDVATIEALVAAVVEAADGRPVKAILETGRLGDRQVIEAAGWAAVAGGARFLKTSTGKIDVGASLEAAEAILSVIASTEDRVGLKVSGGVRTTEDAGAYLAVADQILGPDWVSPATFRFGASGLLVDLRAHMD